MWEPHENQRKLGFEYYILKSQPKLLKVVYCIPFLLTYGVFVVFQVCIDHFLCLRQLFYDKYFGW
jgi:hypothetical protein